MAQRRDQVVKRTPSDVRISISSSSGADRFGHRADHQRYDCRSPPSSSKNQRHTQDPFLRHSQIPVVDRTVVCGTKKTHRPQRGLLAQIRLQIGQPRGAPNISLRGLPQKPFSFDRPRSPAPRRGVREQHRPPHHVLQIWPMIWSFHVFLRAREDIFNVSHHAGRSRSTRSSSVTTPTSSVATGSGISRNRFSYVIRSSFLDGSGAVSRARNAQF